jgi:general secretion pathway protein A
MYAEFYGFRALPFNITPDPGFLYLNDCYQEAIAALTYGIEARKGFISLIGDAGTGKTTLLRRVLDSVDPGTRTVLLLNPSVSFDEILEHILTELGVPTDGGKKLALLQRLNEFLIEHTRSGGNVALLIDEAQDLDGGVLEQLRLLSNLETAREKILQIVLAGQPELETTLSDPALRQLRQRVALRVRLRPLTPVEVAAYVKSRLEHVGATDSGLFTADALERVAFYSAGIPRVVNVLCDAALVSGFAAERRSITAATVDEAWHDYASGAQLAGGFIPRATVREVEEPAPAGEASATDEAPADETVASEPASAPVPPPIAPEMPPPVRATRAPDATPRRRPFSIPRVAAAVVVVALGIAAFSLRERGMEMFAPLLERMSDGNRVASSGAAPVVQVAEAQAAARPLDQGAPRDGVVSATDAAQLIEEFRSAYEARDVRRLLGLFASNASENGQQGHAAIEAAYRRSLPTLAEVRYTLDALNVQTQGATAQVRAPFVIAYRQPSGGSGIIRGEAEWQLERRGGRALIVALNYRLEPEAKL